MKLLALLIAFILSHIIPKPERFRPFAFLQSLKGWVFETKISNSSDLNMLIIIFIPVLLINIILSFLIDSTLGEFLISILVLFYCIGPKSIEEELKDEVFIEKYDLINKSDKDVISAMTRISLQRWFGVFFWYVVLGVLGALLYRFSERLMVNEQKSQLKDSLCKLLNILNYPVSWMMVVALAIASDFERVYKRCKPFMTWEKFKTMDDQFLYDAIDFAVENCEIEEGEKKNIEQITLDVLKRMLVVCLVFVSILVILAI